MPRTLQPSEQSNSLTMNFMINAHCTCVRETLVCIRKTATRHKRGEKVGFIEEREKVGFIENTAMRHRWGG